MSLKAQAALLLLLFTLIIYSNSLGGEFVYDDEYFVVKNIAIRSLENIPLFFTSPTAVAFAELSQDVYRPITTLSYAIDYFLGRLDTFGYHLVNVSFHALNAVLVFLLLSAAFGDLFLAFIAAILFACHPVQTEVVSWISGRSSVLFLFFYLSAMLCYILYAKNNKKAYLAFSLFAFSLSLFSKEMAVTLPLLLIAYDAHFGSGGSFREALRDKRSFGRYAPYFLLALVFIFTRSAVLQRVSQCGWWGGSPYHTFLTMVQVLVDYIKVMLWPVNLCAFYVTNVNTSVGDIKVLSSIAVLAALFALMPVTFRRYRGVSFAIWWFLITLLPVSNIVPLRALMAERFLYLPSIGFCMLAAILIERVGLIGFKKKSKAARSAAIAIAAALVVSYSIRTMMRNEDWKDSVSITRSILKVTPLNPWAFTSLGAAYSGQERHEEAIKPLMKAIVLSNSYFAPRNILGFSYLELGRYDEAIQVLAGALKLMPDNLEALNSLGVAYASVKKYDDAIKQFERSIKVDPTFANAYINLGTTYDRMGLFDKALEAYGRIESITRSRQDLAIARIRMGDVYIEMGLRDKARESYAKAISLCGRGMDQLKQIATDRFNAKWQ
jgi:tetratricopeptide (TPR) repeat protein